MRLPDAELTPVQSAAIVSCLKFLAQLGEADEKAEREQAKKENRPTLGSGGDSPTDATATKDDLSYAKL